MPDDVTIYTVTYVEVASPSEAQGAALLRRYREAARNDAGNLRYDALRRVDRASHFAIVAAWKNQPALEAHPAVASVKECLGELKPLLLGPTDERWHTGLSVAAAPAGRVAAGVYVLTHVDIIPARKDDGVALLQQLAEDSRKDPGNARFDVVQQTNRPNHLTVVEAWKDRPAFDAHAMAAHTRQFRERLAPMSGALYDERLYGALD